MISGVHFYEAKYEALYMEHYDLVEFRGPVPNAMFSPLTNYAVRFLRPGQRSGSWACAECAKRMPRRTFAWTTLLPFKAATHKGFQLACGELHPALTPVCADHPLELWGEGAEQ